jgi:GxxExxY protein
MGGANRSRVVDRFRINTEVTEDTESTEKMNGGFKAGDFEHPRDPLSDKVIGCAIEVHRALGPGLFESTYAECFAQELTLGGIPFAREVAVALEYKGVVLPCAFRIDFLISDELIVELKAVEKLDVIHQSQLLTYMRLARKKFGLLLNFNETLLKNGILRRIL